MYFIKRIFFYLIIILLIVSLYKDLTIGTSHFNDNKFNHTQQIYLKEQESKLSVIQVRVQPGDTVLSITEQINQQLPHLDIMQIMNDFKTINPNVEPYHLQSDTVYYFPLY